MYKIRPLSKIKKAIKTPPDKSISHRAAIISSLSKAKTLIKPFLRSDDTLATLDCMKKLGINVELREDDSLVIEGGGMHFPKKEKVALNARESGTTMRILSGLLCAQEFPVEFKGAPSLNRRPMGRIVYPLREMNAKIRGVEKRSNRLGIPPNIYPPLSITPTDKICAGVFKLPVASAQVKSALMLASLYAKGQTEIEEPYQSRDHTERMLKVFGAKIESQGKTIICNHTEELRTPGNIFIPSDFSSASFFIVLGLLLKNSEIKIKNVNINPTRCGLLKVLKRMGAKIKMTNKKDYYEPYADIVVRSSQLKATQVEEYEIPSMIDEVPILCVAASYAKGKTLIKGVDELVVKETNRVASMIFNLHEAGVKMGTPIVKGSMGISIMGGKKFKRAKFKSRGDHRTAMSVVIFAMASGQESSIDATHCIDKSFPQFIPLINSLRK